MLINKGDFKRIERCPYWAWGRFKGEIPQERKSKSLEKGIYIHDFIKREVMNVVGGEHAENSADGLDIFSADIAYTAKKAVKRLNLRSLLKEHQLVACEENFSIELDDELMLNLRPDLVTYKDVDGHPTIYVWDWKTGNGLSREEDSEAILYAYAAMKRYDMDVIFYRLNVHHGAYFSKLYYREELDDLEEVVLSVARKIKEVAEMETPPSPVSGSHCAICPLLMKCPLKDWSPEEIEERLLVSKWAQELYKRLDGELKEFAKEKLDEDLKEEAINRGSVLITECCAGRFKIEAKTSYVPVPKVEQGGKRKRLKKEDLKRVVIADRELLMEVADAVDIKVDQEVADKIHGKHPEIVFEFSPRVLISLKKGE